VESETVRPKKINREIGRDREKRNRTIEAKTAGESPESLSFTVLITAAGHEVESPKVL
jgi:hypothetical protein